jgi:hypothetical protein
MPPRKVASLGIGAEQVSDREHDMIARIAKELGVDPA